MCLKGMEEMTFASGVVTLRCITDGFSLVERVTRIDLVLICCTLCFLQIQSFRFTNQTNNHIISLQNGFGHRSAVRDATFFLWLDGPF